MLFIGSQLVNIRNNIKTEETVQLHQVTVSQTVSIYLTNYENSYWLQLYFKIFCYINY